MRMGLQSEFRRGVNKIDGMNVSGEEGKGMGFYGPNTLSFLPTQAILSLINRHDDNWVTGWMQSRGRMAAAKNIKKKAIPELE